MTERHMGYVVALTSDIREDDAAAVINALKMIKGVASVTPVTATFDAAVIAAQRRDEEWAARLYRLASEMQS